MRPLAALLLTALLTVCSFATAAEGGAGAYDQLPLSFDEMDEYDRIAMEPYRERYESMPLAEKASAYAVVFAFMRDRQPNYPPELRAEMERYERAKQADSAYEAKQHLYKAPPPPTPRGVSRSEGRLLEGLPGPWEQSAPPAAEKERYRDGGLMESLRYGFNAIDRVRE